MHRKLHSFLWFSVCLITALGLLLTPTHSVLAAIRLVNFTATPGSGKIDLRWETASEVGVAGFYLQRSLQANSGYSRISSFIPATGEGLIGAEYTYSDTGLSNGTTYYFRLEVINSDQSSEFHGPVSATVGGSVAATATSTPSATATSKPSATLAPSATTAPTQTVANPTATTAGATLTQTGSATARLASPSVTPKGSATLSPTVGTPAATTPPARSITPASPSASPAVSPTLQLAAPFATTQADPSLTPAAAPSTAPSGSALPLPLLVLGGAVVFLLLGLGGWGAINSLRRGAPK